MANSKRQCALKTCKKRSHPDTMIIREPNAWCNHECQTQHAMLNLKNLKQSAVKAAKEKKRENTRKKRDHYAKDVKHQKKLTQASCNKLCLLLDKGKPCISSGAPDDGKSRKRNASHFKSRGSNSFLRYSLLNLHAATAHDNNFKSGNIEGYRKGLTERYGPELVEYLDTAPRQKEWACEELVSMRAEFEEECRRLKRGQPPTRNWREVPCSA